MFYIDISLLGIYITRVIQTQGILDTRLFKPLILVTQNMAFQAIISKSFSKLEK